ncbi:hypothetical protein [Terriglobus sp. TAA 43]|uniref:hypothetical protein n=1 Tax=Terriglobus sp. TAA 43 TaxID=278961 RepID=UPI0006479BC7|nr:hypothetical protein [Terriglobus sp. TAA 43]
MPFTAVYVPASTTHTYCGVRSGTAGNAFLDAPDGKDSLTLAEQGGSQRLLEEMDNLVGSDGSEAGTQNGKRYCAVVQLNRNGKPVKVMKAWRGHK